MPPTPAPAPEAETPKVSKEPTRYVICRRIDLELDIDGEKQMVSVLHEEATVDAHGALPAIRSHLAALQKAEHTPGEVYVAIPERNWTESDTKKVQPPPVWEVGEAPRRAGQPIKTWSEAPAPEREPDGEIVPESRGVEAGE